MDWIQKNVGKALTFAIGVASAIGFAAGVFVEYAQKISEIF